MSAKPVAVAYKFSPADVPLNRPGLSFVYTARPIVPTHCVIRFPQLCPYAVQIWNLHFLLFEVCVQLLLWSSHVCYEAVHSVNNFVLRHCQLELSLFEPYAYQCFLYSTLSFRIQSRGGLVQQQELRLSDNGSCYAYPKYTSFCC